ncbi:glutathione S-transferase N-terminal domain-containing protein [Methylopila sp. Yamaguchi]|uniref:glutathione S-transferase N-terminal domain-containing protein n=1 Tax=Methylopila sp. Yamaguchi TaxID=1437817 RepID=UPI000CAAF6AA|nr:glutathione S-transferase N-terminal domain-containing protein [Methylopila sp. Yamaguchi]GBD49415.1 etherase [Methylopila sp. Yamaguchi]
MTAHLYDLTLADGRRLSPYCWAAKLALAHKGVAFETTATRFVDIGKVAGGGFKTVPIVEIDGTTIGDSFELALHLERTRVDSPTLFAGEGGVALTRAAAAQGAYLLGKMSRPMALAIHDGLDAETQVYFRSSRERMFKAPLEEVSAQPEVTIAAAREAMTPLRILLRSQPFIGGDEPLFADFLIAGLFQWARVVGAVDYLAGEDRIGPWFGRLEERYGATLGATAG